MSHGQNSLHKACLDIQVAGNNRPLYPEVDHYWFKVAHIYEPLALQVVAAVATPIHSPCQGAFEHALYDCVQNSRTLTGRAPVASTPTKTDPEFVETKWV